jgi:hypothetical protein
MLQGWIRAVIRGIRAAMQVDAVPTPSRVTSDAADAARVGHHCAAPVEVLQRRFRERSA